MPSSPAHSASPDPLASLRKQLAEAPAALQPGYRRRLRGLERRAAAGQPIDRGTAALARALDQALAARAARQAAQPAIRFPAELPISEHVEAITRALAGHPVVVVAGETGSGKTTQLPKIALAAGRGLEGQIGVTQPRRIAARSIAARVAEELDVPLGQAVGYQVRFEERVSPGTRIKVMTDGILLAETQSDRDLAAYDTLVIDEAHERSLNIDFLLGYLRRLLPRRPDLKVIITSATIDTARFAGHFDDAPVIEVSGRTYPVEVRYRPLVAEDRDDDDRDLLGAIGDAVDELSHLDPLGDILVFLPGERDIRDAQEALERRRLRDTEVLPLFARLTPAEQHRIFHPGRARRIILSTNIAETSLTVPRIRFVIDTGLARISRYSHRSKVQRLPIEAISRASADQRAGRCGRLGPGVCIRLYDEADFDDRPRYTDPEILRVNLATVILQMEALGLGRVHDFPFLDAPDERQVRDGYQLLHELGALDGHNRLTALGRALTRWPLDVRLARLMEAGREHDCLEEAATLAAALSIQDPRVRPLDAQQQADTAHEQWRDPRSDFITWLKLWKDYHETREDGSVAQLRRWCQASFLHFLRMREWSDVRRQLLEIARENGLRRAPRPAAYEPLHRAVLDAFLGQVGVRTEDAYQGGRDQRFHLFPGSGLHGRGPKWIVAAFLVETTRVYAREAASIDPAWVEEAAAHLVKRRYFDPYWSRRAGRVLGYEQVSLYGLVLVSRRRVNYGPHDPATARRIFIEDALVRDALGVAAPFAEHNRRLVARIERLEEKQRRRDLLVDEAVRFAFYDRRVPEGIFERRRFEEWRRQAEQGEPRLLFFTEADLLATAGRPDAEALYPDHIEIDGVRYAVSYRLEPGSPLDGMTVHVPLARLGTLRPPPFEWLVPGYLREKVAALIKSLPKALRRSFVPAPDWADRFVDAVPLDRAHSLHGELAGFLSARSSTVVQAGDFDLSRVPPNLLASVRVFEGDAQVDLGKDLEALQAEHAEAAREQFLTQAGAEYYADDRRRWDFGSLPREVELADGAGAHPAVVDQEDCVGVRLFESAREADEFHAFGVRRLLELALRDKVRYLQRQGGIDQQMCLQYAAVDGCEQLKSDFAFHVTLALVRAFEAPVRDGEAFQALVQAARTRLVPLATDVLPVLAEVLSRFHAVRQALTGGDLEGLFPWAVEDLRAQLDYLVYPGFLTEVPRERLAHYPRYLQAMEIRLERLEHDPARDRAKFERLADFWQRYLAAVAGDEGEHAALEAFHWQLEEYRVSLFAQELGTAGKVSAKRLAAAWSAIEAAR